MRINAKDRLYGYPALAIRKLLRAANWGMSPAHAAAELSLDAEAAAALIAALEADGFLEPPHDAGHGDGPRWQLSVKGAALSMASAAAPMKRAAAEAMLLAFLGRVEQVRDGAGFVKKVSSVVLFGSAMTEAPDLGDLDVAIAFRPLHADRDEQLAAENFCRDSAEADGHNLDFYARLSWPDVMVRRFLKGRHPISMHDPVTDETIVEAGPHATIYADEAVVEGAIPLLRDWNAPEARAAREGAEAQRLAGTAKRKIAAQRKTIAANRKLIADLERFAAMTTDERAANAPEWEAAQVQARRFLARHRRTE